MGTVVFKNVYYSVLTDRRLIVRVDCNRCKCVNEPFTKLSTVNHLFGKLTAHELIQETTWANGRVKSRFTVGVSKCRGRTFTHLSTYA